MKVYLKTKPSSSFSLVFLPAYLTHSCAVFLNICVKGIIRVSSWAMSFLPLYFCKLQSIFPALAIFPVCHNLKMGRIHASVISAKMVKFFPNWDWGNKQFIGKSMGTCILPTAFLYAKYSIARFIFTRRPIPAIVFVTLSDFCPKSFLYWLIFCIHKSIVSRITTLCNGYEAVEPLI